MPKGKKNKYGEETKRLHSLKRDITQIAMKAKADGSSDDYMLSKIHLLREYDEPPFGPLLRAVKQSNNLNLLQKFLYFREANEEVIISTEERQNFKLRAFPEETAYNVLRHYGEVVNFVHRESQKLLNKGKKPEDPEMQHLKEINKIVAADLRNIFGYIPEIDTDIQQKEFKAALTKIRSKLEHSTDSHLKPEYLKNDLGYWAEKERHFYHLKDNILANNKDHNKSWKEDPEFRDYVQEHFSQAIELPTTKNDNISIGNLFFKISHYLGENIAKAEEATAELEKREQNMLTPVGTRNYIKHREQDVTLSL